MVKWPRIISAAQCAEVLTPRALVQALHTVHRDHHRGVVTQPIPTRLPLTAQPELADAAHVLMSAADANYTLVKTLLDAPSRRDLGEPAQRSVISVYSTRTGDCLALIDGSALTRLRTAAATALGVQLLARPDARTLGVLGAGGLAPAHIEAISAVMDIERVLLWARRPEAAAAALDAVPGSTTAPASATVAGSIEEVADAADVLISLTPAQDPILTAAHLHPGMHVAAVGSPPRPGYREAGPDVFAKADLVVVDDAHIAADESQQVIDAVSAGLPASDLIELGAIAAGGAGRQDPADITLHSSIGVAAQDLAAVRILLHEGDETL